LSNVAALIGNSSGGIMEAASFALPTVNVGIRQQGRERARNVIDVPAETTAILAAIQHALDPDFRESLRGMANPYGDGTAAQTIARVLTTVPLDGLLIKQPTPLPEDANPESAEELVRMAAPGPAGQGFSPDNNPAESSRALAPEVCFSRNSPVIQALSADPENTNQEKKKPERP
jgi:hypothetical protein